MGRLKYSYKDVKIYIESYGYKLLSKEYINSKSKMSVKCTNGHEYMVTFSNFKTGYRCPVCYGNTKHSYDFVKGYIEKQGCELLSKEYIDVDTKLVIRCCNGHEYSATFYKFKNREQRCPICNGNPSYNYEKVRAIMDEFGYKLLSKQYNHSKEKLDIECPDGHRYKATFNNFKRGTRCPVCYGNTKHSYEYVESAIKNYGYELLSTIYVNVESKLNIKCDKGHEFKMSYNNLQQGQRCPICYAPSRGEVKIRDILTENNIFFKPQHRFKECRSKKPLPFDFYLPDYNSCIEYDGEQHFHIEHSFSGEEGFKITQKHDSIKTKYCLDNNIHLIRIPYWDFTKIEVILKENLNI